MCPANYACPSNFTSNFTRFDHPCPIGKFGAPGTKEVNDCTSCLRGTYGVEGTAGICAPCLAGFTCPYNGTTTGTMLACSAGMWSSTTGLSSDACIGEQCPAGTYSVTIGLSQPDDCDGCPSSRYSTLFGVSVLDDCEDLPCPAGRFGPTVGASSASDCTACPAGKTSRGANLDSGGAAHESEGCALCLGGRFSPRTHFTGVCTECEVGKTAPAGAPLCFFMCGLGQYWDDADEVCEACAPGKLLAIYLQ